MPGRIARRLMPDIWLQLARIKGLRLILVSGTNGKTTTAHLLHHLLIEEGYRAWSNTSGANLEGGLLTAILTRLPMRIKPDATLPFVLEIDEASLARLSGSLRPQALVLTNFSRDQLDRYGELDSVAGRLGKALSEFGSELIPVLNADDPGVAGLAAGDKSVSFYGLEGEPPTGGWASSLEHHACRVCRTDLAYRHTYLGHLGDWHCPSCGLGRPERRTAATGIVPDADGGGTRFDLRVGATEWPVHLPLPGLYNVYNALAAAETAARLGLSPASIARGLGTATPCFGRGEIQRAGNRLLYLFLIKNPAGTNTVLETLALRRVRDIWFVINDRAADGRDVSWLWDVDLEGFWARNGPPAKVVISGRRALDMAVRLRYSDLATDLLAVIPLVSRGLKAVSSRDLNEPCYVLATYTALLDLRGRLARASRW